MMGDSAAKKGLRPFEADIIDLNIEGSAAKEAKLLKLLLKTLDSIDQQRKAKPFKAVILPAKKELRSFEAEYFRFEIFCGNIAAIKLQTAAYVSKMK